MRLPIDDKMRTANGDPLNSAQIFDNQVTVISLEKKVLNFIAILCEARLVQ